MWWLTSHLGFSWERNGDAKMEAGRKISDGHFTKQHGEKPNMTDTFSWSCEIGRRSMPLSLYASLSQQAVAVSQSQSASLICLHF